MRWTEGVLGDGAAILRDGRMVPITEVLEVLNAYAAEVESHRKEVVYWHTRYAEVLQVAQKERSSNG
jgi:chemotaxis protein histidine kinase CheA